ncbi:MAG: pilus assembly protein [Actinobacteria bacterium]|nr:pilus assembly protein [Actinomycetota bacterium]MBV8958857.1 pilus assembly protein [Actinomycetota bacterium]MBV9253357.1 pilus assembly protein [Actinomycetota bacterium]MBV9663341.1 pilus assembly protein [Actinomycetota bacterium]
MTHLKHQRRDERGAALLEFALVFGIFVFVLYGLIAYGMMLSLKNSVTHAAAEGARAAIGVTSGDADHNGVDDRTDAAVARVKSSLNWLGASKVNATTITVTYPSSCPTSCIDVKISYPYDSQPLVPPAPGLGLVTPSSIGSEAVVALS